MSDDRPKEAEPRRIRFTVWMNFCGRVVEHEAEIESPLVSNQPDPDIQRTVDEKRAKAWAIANVDGSWSLRFPPT